MTVRVTRFGAFLLVASLAVPGTLAPFAAAQAQQGNNNFFGNLFKPPGQVGQGGGQGDSAVPSATDPGEMTVRIDRLENQIRQLTGQIEQLQYRNQQLEAQLKRAQDEADFMAKDRGGQAAAGAAPAARPPQSAVATPPAGAPATGRRSDAFDPNAQPSAPGAPRPLGTTPSSEPAGGRAPGAPMDLGSLSGAAAGAAAGAAGAPGGAQVATLPPSNSPKDLYDLSYGYVLRQDYAQASASFRAFLQQYPADRAAPDAHYWLGESDYQRQQYKEAAQSFLKVSTDYPNSAKAPDALLRLGQSLAAIGENDAACATYNAVGNKYPRASATVRQSVEREQKRARC